MGTYKYEIFTSGYSNEIVVGTMDDEIVNKVEELCDEHDMTIPELYEDFELLGDNEIPEWHENDNKEHIYGPSIDGATLNVVNVETNEVVLEKDFFDLDVFELDEHIVETKLHLYEGKPLFHCATIEKGVAMHGYLDLDEPFDESKLTFKVINLEVGLYEYETVSKLYYNNEPIETEVMSTDYKDFVGGIIKK